MVDVSTDGSRKMLQSSINFLSENIYAYFLFRFSQFTLFPNLGSFASSFWAQSDTMLYSSIFIGIYQILNHKAWQFQNGKNKKQKKLISFNCDFFVISLYRKNEIYQVRKQ